MPYNKDGIGYQKTDTSKAAAYSNYPGKLMQKIECYSCYRKYQTS